MDEFGKKTSRGWEFKDLYTFRVISHSASDLAKVKDDYLGAFKPPVAGSPHSSGLGVVGGGSNAAPQANGQPSGQGITVKIAATHAGLITRNNGFYMPDKMKAGVSSWTSHYPKPIQIHHNDSPGDSQDPIGRVVAARYIDLTDQVSAQFQNKVLRSGDREYGYADRKFWDRFTSDRTSFIDKLNMMKMMDSVLLDNDYQGAGYIELTANITDPVAIPKILDGRYITGSVGAVSDKAVCSVCNTDWLEEEHCGHRPGRIYDGKKCVVVAGNLEYDEYSFVNTPADRHSGILQIQNSLIQDSTDHVVKFFPVFGGIEEDTISMKDTTATAQVQDSVSETPIETQTEVTPVVTDDAAAAAQLVDLQATPVNELETLLDKLLTGNKLTDEENEKLYELQLSHMDKEVIEDSKLPAAKRKKLAASAFCGPQKTFLVTDCAHATAASKLLATYKGPGDTANIAAAIARKVKAFGCDAAVVQNSVKDNVQETGTVQEVVATPTVHDFSFRCEITETEISDGVKVALSKDFLNHMLEKFGKDAVAAAVLAAELAADPSELQALVDEVAKNEELVGELRDRVNALQKELKAAYDDMVQIEDQLISSKENARSAKLKNAHLFHQLDGSLTDELKSQLNVLSDEVLDTTLAALTAKVDINKITDKLNSGLSRTPEEEVEVPAGLTEPSAETQPTNTPTYATQRFVDQVYEQIYLREGNPVKAKAYYDDMVKQGLAKPKK